MSGFHYRAGDRAPHLVAIERHGDGWRVVIDGRAHEIAVRPHSGGRLELTIDGRRRSAYVAAAGTRRWVAVGDRTWQLDRIDGSPKRRAAGGSESGHDVLRQSVKSGAWGFISKADEPEILLDTIATVARGRLCLPYIDLQSLNEDPIETLTARERELLGALADGWSNMQIASRIGISRNTVKYHLKNLYDKLGVKNRAMAVALFVGGARDLSGR